LRGGGALGARWLRPVADPVELEELVSPRPSFRSVTRLSVRTFTPSASSGAPNV
jgi:hypothetical protein